MIDRSAVRDRSGAFVAFEGGDGAGKTTQIERAAGWLRQAGRDVVVTREPGGTELGARIRELLLHGGDIAPRAEALLFAADRAHHIATVVRPAMASGAVVLQDRYIDSSVAYQGAGRSLDPAEIEGLSLWATGDLRPDLTVLLDVSPQVGRRRRGAVQDRLEQEADDFHARVREHFLQLAGADPDRYLVLDAAAAVTTIAESVRARLTQLLGVPA